jgi:hypothetical protein
MPTASNNWNSHLNIPKSFHVQRNDNINFVHLPNLQADGDDIIKVHKNIKFAG